MRNTSIVEEIKEKADVVETIGRLIPLKRSGKSWSGLCPFHKELDGSFHVYEDSGNFVCFGCGMKGDIISFYENYYKLTFLEACEKLAKEYGIDWQPGGSFSVDKGKDALYEANRFAGRVYYEAMTVEGNPALEYLLGRGIDIRTIAKFRLGYADGSGRALAQRLEGDAAMQKAAEEVGLIFKYSGQYRDRFSGRVMFPIVNMQGKVIGFGGRDIDGKDKAKYINSKSSNAYAKGHNLFGLNVTRGAIREKEQAILVEGYMDLIALHMHGVTNVCAQLGTAFTPGQAKLLCKQARNIVIALDADESGQSASEKTMDLLAEAGAKVRVLVLEGAKDPDDFIRAFGKEAWDRAVDRAVPMYDFKLDRIKQKHDLATSDGLADFLKEAAKVIGPLSPVERGIYIRNLSRETGISEEAIAMQADMGGARDELASAAVGARIAPGAGRLGNGGAVRPYDDLLRSILALSLGSGYALEKASAYRYLFDGTDYGGVMNAMIALKERNGTAPTAAELAEMLGEDDQVILEHIRSEAGKGPAVMDEEQIGEYLTKLELAALKMQEYKLKEDISGTSGSDMSVLQEVKRIQDRIIKLESDIRKAKRGE
ncbi:MAG: DNA primase [Clostridiales bacterium]|nr:DNA primase [Clostridiales bacterium]